MSKDSSLFLIHMPFLLVTSFLIYYSTNELLITITYFLLYSLTVSLFAYFNLVELKRSKYLLSTIMLIILYIIFLSTQANLFIFVALIICPLFYIFIDNKKFFYYIVTLNGFLFIGLLFLVFFNLTKFHKHSNAFSFVFNTICGFYCN